MGTHVTRRFRFVLLVSILCCLAACGGSKYTTEGTFRVEPGGFIVVGEGSFRPPQIVYSYNSDGKLLDTKYFKSFHHQAAAKDENLMMLASVRTDKILSIHRDGKIRMFSLPLKGNYDTYFDIKKISDDIWAVSLNGLITSKDGLRGKILYFNKKREVLKEEQVPELADYVHLLQNSTHDMLFTTMQTPGSNIIYYLKEKGKLREMYRFDFRNGPEVVLRECVGFDKFYCYTNKLKKKKGETDKVIESRLGVLNTETAMLENSVPIHRPDMIKATDEAALITSYDNGYLHILTKDGKLYSSQPEGCEECRFWDIDSLHGEIYILYYKDKERAELGDECFVSKWDRDTNKLEKPIRFDGICNTLLMVDK
ncbi:hypothetical protein [Mobiluncus mulieris]|uniref:hypothetical protein n=1 Tax=Mobiluncus mulieris TaxID=2052 RepID=UPI00146FEE1B|nr:hypothetical protein [Mobiluncus mulieris]NMX12496.1 hypothetical protein [Mobiluncus mulieris]